MNRKRLSALLLLLLIIGVGTLLFTPSGKIIVNSFLHPKEEVTETVNKETIDKRNLIPATVLRAIDGDTLLVTCDNKKETVRLIGIDTPESVHPDETKNTKEGEEAAAYTGVLVKSLTNVFLELDKVTHDKYGRLLAYVWLSDKEATSGKAEDTVKEHMLNAILLKKNYAKLLTVKPNTKYLSVFQDIVNK